MSFLDFFSPIRRYTNLWIFLFAFVAIGTFLILNQIPKIQKNIIYFTVKPLQKETNLSQNLDPASSTEKVAETISGWVQNPAFREAILKEANVYLPHFKRKISARKQNVMNVFLTITLYGEDQIYQEKIVSATLLVLTKTFDDFNLNNAFPFGITELQVSSEDNSIPKSWMIVFSVFLGFFLSFLFIYWQEAIRDKISFVSQVRKIFPESPLLRFTQKIGKHDEKLFEQFILTFENPRLIGTFKAAELYFSLTNENLEEKETEMPILLIKVGSTSHQELENVKAIFGEEVGLIVFDK